MAVAHVGSTASNGTGTNVDVALPGSSSVNEQTSFGFGAQSSSSRNRVTMHRFSGVDAATPFLAAPTFVGNASSSTVTAMAAPSVSWATGSMLLNSWCVNSPNSTWTLPTGVTQAGVTPPTGNQEQISSIQAFTSGTTTGTRTATYGASYRYIGTSAVINPSASTGVELLVAVQSCDSGGSTLATMTAPTGWTLAGSADNTSGYSLARVKVWYKYVGTNPLLWTADMTQANVVAAGWIDDGSQRETASQVFSDTSVPWPTTTELCPGGRPNRAAAVYVPDNYYRLEIKPNHQTFGDGDNFYFATAFFMAPDFQLSTAANFQVIEQMRQYSDVGSPGIAFEIKQGQLQMTGGSGIDTTTPTHYSYQQNLATVYEQVWYSLVYRLTFSATAGVSTVDVWLNGVQYVTNYTLPPPTVVGGRTYRKQGIYHSPVIPAGTLYIGGSRFGKTYAAVDPTLTLTNPKNPNEFMTGVM